jgi:hypothetical protein
MPLPKGLWHRQRRSRVPGSGNIALVGCLSFLLSKILASPGFGDPVIADFIRPFGPGVAMREAVGVDGSMGE